MAIITCTITCGNSGEQFPAEMCETCEDRESCSGFTCKCNAEHGATCAVTGEELTGTFIQSFELKEQYDQVAREIQVLTAKLHAARKRRAAILQQIMDS